MNRKWIPALIVTVSCFGLFTCPNPLNQEKLLHVKDQLNPVISIATPAESSYCANIVEVTGRVTDAATSAGNDGQVRSVYYLVAGSTVAGSIDLAADGTFSFQFATVTLGSNFTLSITATDWNGNTAVTSLPLLRQPSSGIPSLAVSQGNHEVTLSWDPVPHTASYTLYYTTNGSLPSEQNGKKQEGVVSPCVLQNLANGNLHVFQIKAVPETGWPESVSDYLKAIPLSSQTLAPRVTGEFRQLRVEWDSIPGAKEFEVWRSTEQNGAYYNLSGPIETTSHIDTDVANDQWYFYRVRPTLSGCLPSGANGARTDPFCLHHPVVLGTCDTSQALGVAVSGNYAYVADGTSGLRVIDISNPLVPTLRATRDTVEITDEARGVAVSGNYAYVADWTSGLQLIDISDPLAPGFPVTCKTDGACGVAVSGDYAYVADLSLAAGLRVVQIDDTNPLAPSLTLRGTCTSFNHALRVAVSGNYAYVADYATGLQMVDISDPLAPSRKTFCGTANAQDVALSGSYAYVADGNSGLKVIEIDDSPVSPSLTLRGTCATSYARGVDVSGPYAYVADLSAGLRIIDISDPLAPTLTVTCDTDEANEVAVRGSRAYVADGPSGLRVIDISNPFAPALPVACGTSSARGVAVSGSYAYVADYSSGLRVIDISNPLAPTLKATRATGQALGVAVAGSYAYVAGTSGLQVINILDPLAPGVPVACGTSFSWGVAIKGDYAYVASLSDGLRVIDISNPLAPTLRATCGTTEAHGVAISGNYAYVADGPAGLRVIDISNPLVPGMPVACDTDGAYGVEISGEYAYIADGTTGLRVIDISNPLAPALKATRDTGYAIGVAVSGHYAYVADEASGLQVIDLNP
jgi:hypothetical protein